MTKSKRKSRNRIAEIESDTVAASDRKGRDTRSNGRTVRARTVEQRHAIAEAALKLFSKFGFVQVTNNEIGELAGVNPALIYYYFQDREDLFQFVVRKALDDALSVYERLSHEPSSGGGLEAWLSSNLLLSKEISRLLKVVLDYAHSERQSRLTDDAIARFYKTEIEILARSLRDEIGLAPQRALEFAQLVSIFLDGVMVAQVVRPEMDVKRIVNSMRELLGSRRASAKQDS